MFNSSYFSEQFLLIAIWHISYEYKIQRLIKLFHLGFWLVGTPNWTIDLIV